MDKSNQILVVRKSWFGDDEVRLSFRWNGGNECRLGLGLWWNGGIRQKVTFLYSWVLPLNVSFWEIWLVLKKSYIHGSVEFSSDRGVAFITFFSERVAKKETFDDLWVKFALELFMDMDKYHKLNTFFGYLGRRGEEFDEVFGILKLLMEFY